MSNVVGNKYFKYVLGCLLFIVSLPVFSILLRIVFEFGRIFGSFVRTYPMCY